MNAEYKTIINDGLWYNNPATVQLLGLCPLLAVTNTFINGLALGLATTLVLIASNATVSSVRHWVRPEIRIPVFVLIIASFVTITSLVMQAFFYELFTILGIFIPLIVTNCAIIGRAEAFASKNKIHKAMLDGLVMGAGFTIVLIILGAAREMIGQATLFSQAHLLLGEAARAFEIDFSEHYRGFLLAILAPGAFIGLGFIIAIKNVIDERIKTRSNQSSVAVNITDVEVASNAKT